MMERARLWFFLLKGFARTVWNNPGFWFKTGVAVARTKLLASKPF